MIVSKSALTPMAPMSVSATVDTEWILMDSHAEVGYSAG